MHYDASSHSPEIERVRELDGLRALAILLVVAWHYLGVGDGLTSVPWRIFIAGRTGVDLFFVLSGYLITGILLANAESSKYFSTFYGRRSFRILPIYGAMVIIYLIGRHLGGSARILFDGPLPSWSYIIGLQNIWMAIDRTYGAYWLGGTWSLAIEEQFYLVFPLVVYFTPSRILPRLLIALLVLCPVGRIIWGSLGDQFGYYVLMPLRADILAIGALIAWLEFSGSISPSVRRTFQLVFWSTACFFPMFAWFVELSDFNMAMWGHTYLVALFGSMVFLVLDRRGAPQFAFLRGRFAGFFARISYALYLTHGSVLILVFLVAKYNLHTILTWEGAALTVCAFAISVSICSASYRFIEAPLIKMAHRKFRFGKPKPIGADAPAPVSA
jgi:peptidoglycan/LPS O-acetylase OafA/YrhL